MKKIIRLFCLLIMILSSLAGFSQKYKTVEDTIKLTKEYVKVSNDIATLSAKLTVAENDLPGYQQKVQNASSDAANAATASSDQASKATNGDIGDARSAKRKAKKAFGEAKDLRSAKNNVSDQENKITRYKLDLQKKQQRLGELDVMRAAINAKILINSAPPIPQ